MRKKDVFPARIEDRGIPAEKADIVKQICPLFRYKNRVAFWKSLPVRNVEDLLTFNSLPEEVQR